MAVSEKWTIWLCNLIKDYIDAAAGVDGIPLAADVPRFVFDEGEEVTDPHLHFSAVIRKRQHEYLLPMTLEIRLVTQAAGENATTETVAVGWQQAIRRRIQAKVAGVSTFGAWLAALSSDTRRGWQIVAEPTMNAEPDIAFDFESGRRICTEELRLAVVIEKE